jgi:hypothetical protein
MGACNTKIETVSAPVQLSRYSISFKYYITSLRTKILTDKMIDDAFSECKSDANWVAFFKSAFKHTYPNVLAQNITVKLMKITKNEYNGEVQWNFPTTPYYQINTDLKIVYPTGVYTIGGANWAGICFIESVKCVSEAL